MRWLILGILVLAPSLTLAADTAILGGPIVPECETWGGICQACDVITLVDNVLKFLVAFTTVIAALMFLYAGLLYVTAAAKPANIDTAKKIFSTVLFGLIIVLVAWLIIDIIMRVFTNQDLNVLTQIECVEFDSTVGGYLTTGTEGGGVTTGGAGNPTSPTTPPAGRMTDEDAREKLLAAGVTIESSGNCSDRGNSTCTSLDGIPAATVDKIIAMKKACNCEVVVTGGTEVGHISHRPGQPRVDISYSKETADYIKANRVALGITAICTTAADAAYRYNCTYNETERHLHLQF
ncbi:MAG: pilin [Patescibacteria group bacterium]